MNEESKNKETKEEEVKEEVKEVKEEVKEEEAADTSDGEEPAEEKPIDKMTSPELKEIAKKIPGVTGVTAMKKADLLALIKEHRGIVDEEPKKASAKKGINVKEIKKKIVELKAAKAAAREAKNRKDVDILRRRINRLKKMTRKAG